MISFFQLFAAEGRHQTEPWQQPNDPTRNAKKVWGKNERSRDCAKKLLPSGPWARRRPNSIKCFSGPARPASRKKKQTREEIIKKPHELAEPPERKKHTTTDPANPMGWKIVMVSTTVNRTETRRRPRRKGPERRNETRKRLRE